MNGTNMDQGLTERGAQRRSGVKPLPETVFNAICKANADDVYNLLADLHSHLDWAGARQNPTTRLLTMDAPTGVATVGMEFRTTGSDGKVARWTDRSVITEAMAPRSFEFVTEGVRHGKPGRTPMQATTVHRYEIEPAATGCRVTYRGQITQSKGFPAIVHAPVVGRLLLGYAAKYMRKGFDSLIATAEERSAVS